MPGCPQARSVPVAAPSADSFSSEDEPRPRNALETEIDRGSLLRPDRPCASGGGQCYSKEQLRRIADLVSKRYPDIGAVASQVLRAGGGGDIRWRDMHPVLDYLNSEQSALSYVKRTVTPRQWRRIRADPLAFREIMPTLPASERRQARGKFKVLIRKMDPGLMPPGRPLNPFHQALTKADRFTATVMYVITHRRPMPIHSWPDREPDNPAAWDYDANLALEDGDPAAAAQYAGRALELSPGSADALSLLSAAQYDQKDFALAAQSARRALAVDPTNAQALAVSRLAHNAVGSLSLPSLSAQKASPGANPAQDASAASRPSLSDQSRLAVLIAEKESLQALNGQDYAAARAAAGRALAADARSASAYGLRAMAELGQNDAEAALADARAGLALDGGDRMSRLALARALLRLNRYGEGLSAARAAIAGDPRNAYARFMAAEAAAGLGRRAESLEALKQAAGLDPRYQKIYEAALQAPRDSDMAFLFPDLAKPTPPRPPEGSRGWRFLAIALAAACGGALLAWALRGLLGRSSAATSAGSAAADGALLRGQYQTLRQIGSGGMGMVFEGRDVSLDRPVAIKRMREELRLDRRQRERFVAEARLVAALHHPNIVDIYSIVDEGDELYLIFEFVPGKTLHELVHGEGPIPYERTVGLLRGIAGALEYAHARGIVHRDLKPSNIMVAPDGSPKVMDFGIARAARDAMAQTMTATIVGTPPYMAPEQEEGVVRKEADIYALGVCLYEMLSGRLPFSGSNSGMLMSKVNKSFPPISRAAPWLPPGLDAVFGKALEPDPERRYRGASELLAAFESAPAPARG